MISFLKKYYNLCSFIPQNNNYVIFDRYFGKPNRPDKTGNSTVKPKTSETYYKQRTNPIVLEKVSLNLTQVKKEPEEKISMSSTMKVEPEDSLNKLTEEMKGMNVQQPPSFKVKDQTKSSFGCPWAIEDKLGFRTTSNAYGNYYTTNGRKR